MNDQLFISALKLLPKNAVSRLAGALTRWNAPAPVRLGVMKAFAARYGIDLSECPDLEVYRTFGEFFARPLRPGLRPIAPGEAVIVSPVDGAVSETGVALDGRLVQAKGLDYPTSALVADEALAARLRGGAYATIYLSPRDYHRIHFPLGGKITGWRYVPGQLWPVNPASVRTVPGLFTVNERLVTVLETPLGACAVVAVGATVVGRVRAFYDPTVPVTNLPAATAAARDYESPLPIEKGGELGAFEMGSTVILLFEPGRVRLDARLVPGARLRVGEPIGGPA
ncbi:archaetidylserine decarboxylase [Anaeromyxobacter sp. Fw109-5]|uniref:archaetidylserine decarboxylase n=1 Tax=Anaeromyxobacter sp. (strain Fw109-5) TaxID=404589 RepID=UPI0000ED75F0|nr:archaetidylserine decarboxylase [Anaeromyxobacter sp. Fw109-5]ABS26516.1 phosphatidylserine decarboxylase [Anaeromyxobacter sp. Fw109-5]